MAKILTQPKIITAVRVEAVLMPNGEVICNGKTLGYFKNIQNLIHDFPDQEFVKSCNESMAEKEDVYNQGRY